MAFPPNHPSTSIENLRLVVTKTNNQLETQLTTTQSESRHLLDSLLHEALSAQHANLEGFRKT